MPTRLLLLPVLALLLLPATAGAREDEESGEPLDTYFKGRVVSIEKGVVTLFYDFSDESQLEDWMEKVPFPVLRQPDQAVEWKDERLEIRGSTAAQHVAEFEKGVQLRCQLHLDARRDLGGLLTPIPATNDFASFGLAERYFHSWDVGQTGGQHTILKFGDQWREGGADDDYIGFRYVSRRPPAERLVAGRSIVFAFGLRRGKLSMQIGKQELKGKDLGKKMKIMRPGLYVVKGRMQADDITIQGKLSEDWLLAKGLALRLSPAAAEED